MGPEPIIPDQLLVATMRACDGNTGTATRCLVARGYVIASSTLRHRVKALKAAGVEIVYHPRHFEKLGCGTKEKPVGKPATEPTCAMPGSEEKIAVLRARLMAGEELFHEADAAIVLPPKRTVRWAYVRQNRTKVLVKRG